MKNRLIPLLAVLAFALLAVPAAEAQCVRCHHTIDYSYCDWGVTWGYTDCYEVGLSCIERGDPCGAPNLAPLSSEYTVAAVERLDEPEKPAETLIARKEP